MTRNPRNRSALQILIDAESALLVALLCLVGAYFLYFNRAFLHFPHAWDPGDGDVLNAVHRIQHGLPIYGDWRRGEIMQSYTPLMHLALAALSFLGAEPVTLLRAVNLLLLCLCGGLVFGLALDALSPGPFRVSLAALSGLVFFTAWQTFGFAVQFRPDPLLLALALTTVWLLRRTPERIRTIAALSVLCFLAKQTGLSVGAACALYYALGDRTRLTAYLAWTLGFALLAVIPLEVWSGGHFLLSVLWYPGRHSPPGVMQWTFALARLEDFAARFYLGFIPLLALGLFSDFSSRPGTRPRGALGVSFLVTFLMSGWAARNGGGGSYYYWIPWALASVLALVGLDACLAWFGTKGWITLVVPLVAAGVLGMYELGDLFHAYRLDTRRSKETSVRSEEFFRHFLPEHPGRWMSDRFSLALVRHGQILDRELCTLKLFLMSLPDESPEVQRFLASVESGRYQYIKLSSSATCGRFRLLEEAVARCYTEVENLEESYYNQPVSSRIYAYRGTCKS